MQWKLALVVTLLAAAPAAAQIAITPTPSDDQTRPRRGILTPEEQQRLEDRAREEGVGPGRLRAPEDYNIQRTYEGRATFTGTRPGKCPMNGAVRANVRGNVIDASLTFPIERDSAHGFISGSRFEAKGNFGYTFQGAITDHAITGTITKRQTVKRAEQPKPGVSIPFLPGPTTTGQPPPPPLIQDCSYSITLTRADAGPPPTQR